MEVPDLGSSSIWCLDYKVSVADQIKVSVIWQLGNNVEISLNIETKLLVELSLSWFLFILINIDNLPLLVSFSILVFNNYVSVFIVKSS